MVHRKTTLVKAFVFLGNLGVPVAVIILFLLSSRNWQHVAFLVFMITHCLERVWETFYTTKERRADEFHGDWTLAWVTAAYIVLCFSVTFEFFLRVEGLNSYISMIGIVCYGFAVFIRWSGMRALGKQWAIHAVGAQKIGKVRLIKIGVYKYIRHPIYLGIIFEVVSIPIISNTFLSFLLAMFVNVPLQILRMKMEEKNNIRRLGKSYEDYMQKVSALIPIKFIRKKYFKNVVTG